MRSSPTKLIPKPPAAAAGSSSGSRHLSFLQKPKTSLTSAEIADDGQNSKTEQLVKTEDSHSSVGKSTLPEVKICVKLPNSGREILTLSPNKTCQDLLILLQRRKKRFTNPELITCDFPAKRVSGSALLSTTLMDLGIENNSVVHFDEL